MRRIPHYRFFWHDRCLYLITYGLPHKIVSVEQSGSGNVENNIYCVSLLCKHDNRIFMIGMNCIVLVHFICHGFSYEKNMIVIIQRRQVVSADIG